MVNDGHRIRNEFNRLNIEIFLERRHLEVIEGSMHWEGVGFPDRFHELEGIEIKFLIKLAVGDAEDGFQLRKEILLGFFILPIFFNVIAFADEEDDAFAKPNHFHFIVFFHSLIWYFEVVLVLTDYLPVKWSNFINQFWPASHCQVEVIYSFPW